MSLHLVGPIASSRRFAAPPVANDFSAACDLGLYWEGFRDESPMNWNVESGGYPTRDAVRTLFGGSSMLPIESQIPGNTSGASPFTPTAIDPLGTADFTIEFWIAGTEQKDQTLASHWLSFDNRAWQITYGRFTRRFEFSFFDTTGTLRVASYSVGNSTAGNLFWADQWHHVAVSRVSGVITVYVDGVAGSVTYNSTATPIRSVVAPLQIGSRLTENATTSTANYREFRYTLGHARYTGAFTPPTGPFPRSLVGDPQFGNVKLLLGLTGLAGLTTWGSSGQTYQTAKYQLPRSSFDARGLQVSASLITRPVGVSQSYNFLNQNFTVEVFKLWASLYNNFQVIGVGSITATTELCWSIRVESGSLNFIYSVNGTSVTDRIALVSSVVANVEYDIAVVRDGGILKGFVNGVQTFTRTIGTLSFFDNTATGTPLSIHSEHNAAGTENSGFKASPDVRVRAFRVTKGLARYPGTSYPVPALPLPTT